MIERRGFSLVEMMVVIFLIAVVVLGGKAASTIVLERNRVKAAALTVVADLDYARQLARSQQVETRLVVAEGGGSYLLVADGEVIPRQSLLSGIKLTIRGGQEVAFDKFGRSVETTLELTYGRTTRTITVERSGTVRLEGQ